MKAALGLLIMSLALRVHALAWRLVLVGERLLPRPVSELPKLSAPDYTAAARAIHAQQLLDPAGRQRSGVWA